MCLRLLQAFTHAATAWTLPTRAATARQTHKAPADLRQRGFRQNLNGQDSDADADDESAPRLAQYEPSDAGSMEGRTPSREENSQGEDGPGGDGAWETDASVRHKAGARVELLGSRARQTHSSVTSLSNTGHMNSIAEMRPCMSRSDCGLLLFPCDNAVRTDVVDVKICKEIMADPTQDEPVRRIERGLYWNGTQPIPEGTWVACFGPVRCNDRGMQDDLGYAVQVLRGSAQGDGEWSRTMEMVTPIHGWQGKFDGPYVNHTCCIHHVNAEFVPTEDYGEEEGAPMTTVNVRTVKSVGWERPLSQYSRYDLVMPEILVDYGPDFRKIVGVCRCCACRKATPRCERRSSA